MRDVVVLALTAAFFLVCVAYVRWCDHIIGPDPDTGAESVEPTDSIAVDDDAELVGRP